MLPALTHVESWIFDLDNTLYPASADLFGLIDQRMTAFVAKVTGMPLEDAYRFQKRAFIEHGTTLSGLMATHDVDPHEFLNDVHDIDVSVVAPAPVLVEAIARLPGRKLVFTNGDAAYAARVLARLGLGASFEAIHDIHACAYRPKPAPESYRSMIEAFRVEPTTALFVEDMARNLRPAKALGMTTVWVNNGSEQGEAAQPDYVDYEIAELGPWLDSILEDQ